MPGTARAFWELQVGDRPLARIGWLGGQELLVAGEQSLRALLANWFRTTTRGLEVQAIGVDTVERFLEDEVPPRLPGGAFERISHDRIPAREAWLAAQERRVVAKRGERDHTGDRSNRWPPQLDLPWLLEATTSQRVIWTRGRWGGFTAGGYDRERAQWVTVSRCGPDLVLVTTVDHAMWRAPLRERVSWFRHGPLGHTWRWLDRRVPERVLR